MAQPTKTILVCGPAPGLYADIEAAKTACGLAAPDLMAVNMAAGLVECADYLFSLHPEIMGRLRRAQAALLHRASYTLVDLVTVSAPPERGEFNPAHFSVNRWIAIPERRATSGVAAIFAALALGYDEIILCGVPLTGGDGAAPGVDYGPGGIGHKVPDGPTMVRMQTYARRYAAELARRFPAARVYSMSGYTREILPPPGSVLKEIPGDTFKADQGGGNGEKQRANSN